MVTGKVPLLRPALRRLSRDQREFQQGRGQDAQPVRADGRHLQKVLARVEVPVARRDGVMAAPPGIDTTRPEIGRGGAADRTWAVVGYMLQGMSFPQFRCRGCKQ